MSGQFSQYDTWDNLGFHNCTACGGTDTCEDEDILNTGADGDCTYADSGYDCNGDCINFDCAGTCNGAATIDECGVCDGDGSSCAVNACVSVDMTFGDVGDAGMKARIGTVNGEYNPSDWVTMDQAGTVYSICLTMYPGNTYGYNFNNNIGSGYESGSDLGDCAGGSYGNDRVWEIPADASGEIYADTVCWESCDACPVVVEGCTDATAENYNSEATLDDGSCEYEQLEAANLFISEAAEGSSNNKYIEIYNASGDTVDLSAYAYPTVSNEPSVPGEYFFGIHLLMVQRLQLVMFMLYAMVLQTNSFC